MDAPVGGPGSRRPVAGLFGKLPAHGDFVRRGWPDETVDAIDRWLTAAIGSARKTRDDAAYEAWMRAAPLWRGYVPPGRLGTQALHVAVAPSVDRAGRLFPVVAGVAGEEGAAWAHAAAAGGALDAAIYDALAGERDADDTVHAIAMTLEPAAEGAGEPPVASAWWLERDGPPALFSGTVDASLLERLLNEGQG